MEDSLVLELVFCLELGFVDGETSHCGGLALGDHHSEFKLSHEGTCLFGEDGIGHQQFVLEAFLDTDSSSHGILEGVESEAERGVVVKDLVEELSALLDLKVVAPVHSSLVDSTPGVQFLGLSFTARHEHVQGKHVVDCELLGIDSLLEALPVEDDLVAVNQMLLELVRKHTLQGSDLVGIRHLLDDLSDLVVEVSGLDEPECGLSSFVGSQDNVGFLSGDGSIFIGLDDDGVSNKGSEPIDVYSQLDFDEITFLDEGGVLLKGSKVTAYFVGGDGGGEGEALEDWFFIIDLGEFLVDLAVGPEAELEGLGTNYDLFEKTTENLCIR